jgi:glutathione transport system substrate-binding protein
VRSHAEGALLAFINSLAHPSAVMISPAALKKYGNKDIAQNPVGTGPFKFVEWKQTDYLKVEVRRLLEEGLPEGRHDHLAPVVDNNTRAAMMQTGEAHFAFPMPYEQAELLKKKPSSKWWPRPRSSQRYLADQHAAEAVRQPEGARSHQLRDQQGSAGRRWRSAGYAIPAEGVMPKGVKYAEKLGPWPYDPKKARSC